MAKTQWNTMKHEISMVLKNYATMMYSIGDEYARCKAQTKSREDIMKNAKADIDAYAMGTYTGHRSIDDLRTEYLEQSKKVSEYKSMRDHYESQIEKFEKQAMDLFSDDLYKAYCNRMEDSDAYKDALRTLFSEWNVKITPSTMDSLLSAVGCKVVGYGRIGQLSAKKKDGVVNDGLKNVKKNEYMVIMIRTINKLRGFDEESARRNALPFIYKPEQDNQ